MRGRTIAATLLLMVFMVACFLAVPVVSGPISSGEHPWTSDRNDDTYSETRPTVIPIEDTVSVSEIQQAATSPAGGDDTDVAMVSLLSRFISVLSWVF